MRRWSRSSRDRTTAEPAFGGTRGGISDPEHDLALHAITIKAGIKSLPLVLRFPSLDYGKSKVISIVPTESSLSLVVSNLIGIISVVGG